MAYIKDSEIYKIYGKQAISSITVADLVTAIKKITLVEPNNLVLLKYAFMLLEMVQKDASGRTAVIDQNSASLLNYQKVSAYLSKSAFAQATNGDPTRAYNAIRVLDVVAVTSDGGGNLAADVNLKAALASYFSVVRVIGVLSDAGETPTWVFNGPAAPTSVTTSAHTAGVISKDLEDVHLKGSTDNAVISLDTTSSGLGAAKNYWWFLEGWWET